MTFIDLQTALSRLSSDPRIHPNTPIVLVYSVDHGGTIPDVEHCSEPLCSIAIEGHTLVLSMECEHNALAR